jgi:hypothetical protein
MNAKIGSNNGLEHVRGQHGIREMNENGELFFNLCATYDLIIGGSLFIHKKCHQVTWVSPDYNTENQIDHIAINRKFRRSLTNVRNRRGADIGSDHCLVVADFQFKIMAVRKRFEIRGRRFSIQKLREKIKQEEFKLEFKNRFSALSHFRKGCQISMEGS